MSVTTVLRTKLHYACKKPYEKTVITTVETSLDLTTSATV
jgi:hypothetical protein